MNTVHNHGNFVHDHPGNPGHRHGTMPPAEYAPEVKGK